MMLQGFPEVGGYKVLVECITYNHAQFIEDALRGFAMQQTHFPYICCIYDDASQDGEQEVLRQWVKDHCNQEDVQTYDHPLTIILMAPDKDNPNCIYAIHLQKVNTWGKPEKRVMMRHWKNSCKYVALCEGDDYWTYPLKLQKQVDFLEANPEYSMCFHAAQLIYHGEIIIYSNFSKVEDREYSGVEIFEKWQVPTASVVYRTAVLKSQIYNAVIQSKKFIYGDTPLFCAASCVGKLYGMSDVMSVYRRHEGGVTMREKSVVSLKRFYEHILEFGFVFGNAFVKSCKNVAAQHCIMTSLHLVKRFKIKDALLYFYYSLRKNTMPTIKALFLFPWRYIIDK